ncbi:MAG: ABC transporter permease subunit [Firmicutes bacterium]|nr:ABC transporter permease subunit [Bacillota bacterium]
MSNVAVIFRREVSGYFVTPVAYVVFAVFLVLSGYFFTMSLFATQTADMSITFGNMSVTLLFVAPVLTMKMLAEEGRQGTMELLLTSPASLTSIVVGKYLAAVFTFLVLLLVTALYPISLFWVSKPDLGPILSGYLGILLLGAACLAVGMFASSLTESQVVAGMLGFGLLLLFWVLGWASGNVTGVAGEVLGALSLLNRLDGFTRGIINGADVLYYLSFAFAFVFLTVRVVDARRWS